MLLNGESNSVLRAIIDPWVWFLSFPAPDSDFWETGYHHDHLPKTYGRTSWQGDIELFRVRFLLDDLTAGADHPAPANAAARTPLPKAEAERVSRAILEIWTNTVTEARALELARGMCTDHKVSRDPFLETFRVIRGGKKPGKPASNDK